MSALVVSPQPPFPQPKQLTDVSQVAGADLAPMFVNKVTVSMNPQFTRIAFGEFITGNQETDTTYHSVIVMPTLDAENLGKALVALADNTRKLAAAQAEQAAKDAGK